jgi:uncharacterized protein HemY
MNSNYEFEWRSGMRHLGGGVEPANDLWPNIAAQIASRPTARQNNWQIAFALAATLVIALGAGLAAQRGNWQTLSADSHVAPIAPTAMDWAQPRDAKLAAAARDLDNASANLQQALEQRPDAVFLVGLLNRANGQRMRLLRHNTDV